MSIGKEAPRILCKRKWRTCTSMSDAESEDRASTVDDGGAFEEDAEAAMSTTREHLKRMLMPTTGEPTPIYYYAT